MIKSVLKPIGLAINGRDQASASKVPAAKGLRKAYMQKYVEKAAAMAYTENMRPLVLANQRVNEGNSMNTWRKGVEMHPRGRPISFSPLFVPRRGACVLGLGTETSPAEVIFRRYDGNVRGWTCGSRFTGV